MKYISWNVNGIRACIKKGFFDYLESENPDAIGLQEIKARPEQLTKKDLARFQELGYHSYRNPAERPGYSGTAIFTKKEPIGVYDGFHALDESYNGLNTDDEGRILTLEYEDHYFITVYTPNSKDDLSRLGFRENEWDVAFLDFLLELQKKKPVIVCGDLNVAHKEIDLARPKQNTKSAGFTIEERKGMDNYLDAGFIDTFRFFYPDETDRYSWWSYRGGARNRNVGWRIDYFLTSPSLKDNLKDAIIRDDVLGSDHCPVGLTFSL